MTVFTEYIRVDGRTNRKKISVNSNKTEINVDRALVLPYVLAPVVQKVDNAIHRINHYAQDSTTGFATPYPLDSDLSSG